MREYACIRRNINDRTDVAKCGLVASLLYNQGFARCDNFGRLEGAPEKLATVVLPAHVVMGVVTITEVEEARDQLVRAGIWHQYTVDGVVYVEYVDYDETQQPSWLSKRGAAQFPDPPDRPEMAEAARPRYTPEVKETPTRRGRRPKQASADLEVKGKTETPATPPDKPKQEEPRSETAVLSEGFSQLGKCHEQHTGRPLSSDDNLTLRKILTDAMEVGVEWQTLLTIMREKQASYQPLRAAPTIKSVRYYLPAWEQHLRTALQTPQRTAPPPPPPEEEEDDPVAAVLRQREQQQLAGTAHGT